MSLDFPENLRFPLDKTYHGCPQIIPIGRLFAFSKCEREATSGLGTAFHSPAAGARTAGLSDLKSFS